MSIAQATKERPIEFSGPSATDDIRAIISGAKTQHRLLVNPQPTQDKRGNWVRVNRRGCPVSLHRESTTTFGNSVVNRESVCIAPPECIYTLWPAPATVGQNLWVKEPGKLISPRAPMLLNVDHRIGVHRGLMQAYVYREQEPLGRDKGFVGNAFRFSAAHCMPRWASRLTLRVTGLRVEQLQDITEDDAKAEGVDPVADSYVTGFCHKWHEINGPDSWAANPWVWVVEFERVQS